MSGLDIARLGATEAEWDHFASHLSLLPDLLPIVANPEAKISDRSGLSADKLGKVPSVYKWDGTVVGFAGWGRYQANESDLRSWKATPDYGIGIHARTVRAIDVDVDDPELASEIRHYLDEFFQGRGLPTRLRENSGRFLQVFQMPGELASQVLPVGGGVVELLTQNQQFVVAGRHPSGARYYWEGGLPIQIPRLDESEFERLWADLAEAFATGPVQVRGASHRQLEERLKIDDPVEVFLRSSARVLDERPSGLLYITCPWEKEHTTGKAGDGSTVWMLAGTNGYSRGNFKCLHAHCLDKSSHDYLDAIGYVEDYSEDFGLIAGEDDSGHFHLSLERDKSGKILPSAHNIETILSAPRLSKINLKYDAFLDQILIAYDGDAEYKALTDPDYIEIQLRLSRALAIGSVKDIQKQKLRDVVAYVASVNTYDSAIEWLNGLEWDGVCRVDQFLVDAFGTEDTDYHRAVSQYIWTALASRVLEPGSKADMAPIAVGSQGTGKSSVVAAIPPSDEFFSELDLGLKDADISRLIRSKMVVELGELKGMRAKEVSHIKQFITRQIEEWTPKYKEMNIRYPRRCLFFGTTNEREFLRDETGNRRWLPFNAGQCNPEVVKADRDQYWAEARHLFLTDGVLWQDAQGLASSAHDEFREVDPWESSVLGYVESIHESALDDQDEFMRDLLPQSQVVHIKDILIHVIGLQLSQQSQSHKLRVSRILTAHGYKPCKRSVNGKSVRVYEKSCD
jgi:GNAT superfamily N-acetyltransferase